MTPSEFYSLTRREQRVKFFEVAARVNLVKDGVYISGIPTGSSEDVNLFYRLEDWCEYPRTCKIPENYLKK